MRFNLAYMGSLRRARWLSAVLIAPVLVCAVAASSYLALRCRFTGMVTLDVCCPQAGDDTGADASATEHATVSDPGCCERLLLTVAKLPCDAPGRALDLPVRSVTALIATPASTVQSPRPWGGSFRRTVPPPGIAPPAFLLRHSFLI